MEIRVTGVDDPSWAGTPGALAPALSAVTPRPDHPEWDTAVWLDVLTLPGTPGAHRFYRDLERALFTAFDGTDRSALRVEWSKGWAYTDEAAWSDAEVIGHRIPGGFPAGPGNAGWEATLATLRGLDPHGVLESPLLRDLMGPGSP
ncbi:cholesterol oxidase substrate-binding domain-containing protein [Streptomyces sp. NPDC059740]|uniref:cholesterol oxidase substrate-binding domain-containing protein n=1 Tax=Streptomyces sp. NPDC059740 TaxID=3346926 RepID=UPI00365ED021